MSRMRPTALLTATLALLLVSGPALRAQRPLGDQAILDYLNQTVGWYRDVTAALQSPTDSREALFADGLRRSSLEALQLGFEFALAQAAIPAADAPESASPGGTRGRNLSQAVAAAGQRAEEAKAEIDQINRRIQTASGQALPVLRAQRDEVTSELNFAVARRDSLRNLLGFFSLPGEGGLSTKIGDIERTVPEAVKAPQNQSAPVAAPPRAVAAQGFHPESAGIVGLTTELLSVSRTMGQLDLLVRETDSLRQANQQLRAPLRKAMQAVITEGDVVAKLADTANTATLLAEKQRLDALLARFKQVTGSSAPLSEQSGQIASSRALLLEWRAALRDDYSAALRYLLLRAGMLALALLLIFALSEIWRRATVRYVRDLRRRRQFLLLRRVVVGCTIALFVVLSFVTEFGSLATFAGFSAAGIAVAMQSVILSVVAYFFLVGRWGVRVGDRVTVSGVTGEVVDVGLFRLYLMELGGSGLALQPTGRIVVFPNAVFFQPSALFKQLPGIEYGWRAMTLTLAATTDYSSVEKRLLSAVQGVYAEYGEAVERQHREALTSMNLHTPPPHPESRLRLVEAGLEITIRYPVEISRGAEIDDRMTRAVIEEIEREPTLRLADGSTPKIETRAG
jgi:small-conductance mechanosensitive channel